ncbi:ankyrin repeat and LEM domain-containing protein 1 [Bactrocera tryoni]|uniref:ankyrin repeat and LEM domain-containing protein 1 n=1 Tax=Bactrocera tryoni TaxID=59916 RepID=UPI001A969083|nr:ankyrin repeat and LEM domain-containing protein 1 [Bactrocera tryoni]
MCIKRKFSMELQRTISSTKGFQSIQNYEKFESISSKYFNSRPNFSNKKKLGLKQCYLYFLMDPRKSRNLPVSAKENSLKELKIWQRFLNSIFYVGKAKSTRPYSHLHNAIKIYNKQELDDKAECLNAIVSDIQAPKFSKVDHIIDIWRNGFGVVNLHVFHNILPYEAYTREAAVIDAISLPNLTNQKRGVYYGPPSKWTAKGRERLGIALLYRAMKIFLSEGEIQLYPFDLA